MKKLFILMLLLAVIALSGISALAQDDEFVFGVVMVGPKNDRGWSQAHYEAGLHIEETQPNTRMVFFESLNPADAPETTLQDVVTQMVDAGAKVIFTTSDEFQLDTDVVAANFPEIVFINTTGSTVLEGAAPPNVGNLNGQMEWTKAISGCAAGLATQTGKLGYVGALINFETRRLAAATYLGARYCYEKYAGGDPDALEFNVTWIGFWFNIPGITLDPTVESNTLFDSGADVVISGIDTTESLVVANQRRQQGEEVWAMSQDNPAGCDEAPEACLGSPYYNWYPGYLSVVNQVKAGTWEQAWTWLPPDFTDINNVDTSPNGFTVGEGLTEEQREQLDAFIAEMAAYASDPENADSMFLWQGPLNLQDGTELVAEGEQVALLDIWYLPQLLEGMAGASSSQ